MPSPRHRHQQDELTNYRFDNTGEARLSDWMIKNLWVGAQPLERDHNPGGLLFNRRHKGVHFQPAQRGAF